MFRAPAQTANMGILPNHEKTVAFSPERAAAVRAELAAIVKSSSFSGSKRCQDFLEFIVSQALEGNYDYLTERFLGSELFGRPINYETGTDSIVRVRANDVRRRLAQYYSEGHGGPQVAIDLVSGTYVPDFHWKEQKSAEPAPNESPVRDTLVTHGTPIIEPYATTTEANDERRRTTRRWPTILAVAVICVLGFCVGLLLVKQRDADRSVDPWKYAPSMGELWSGFLDSGHETDVVLSDASFQLVQDISKRTFTLDDYLNRSYFNQAQTSNSNPDVKAILTLIASKNFGNSGEFRLAQRVSALDRSGSRIRVYNSRDFSPTLAEQDNVVLLGTKYSNPWQQLFESRLNFVENPPGALQRTVINKSPKPGENSVYSPTDALGYCVVAYLSNPDHSTKALLIEGSSSEATEAGGDFLLSEDKLSGFKKMLHTEKLPYFEVLLKTSQVRGTPITASVEAYRVYSSQP